MNQNEKTCPSCLGDGYWMAECCGAQGGCSCNGQPINMGCCNVCHGTGKVIDGQYDERANLRTIEGYGYIGDGGNNPIAPAMNRI